MQVKLSEKRLKNNRERIDSKLTGEERSKANDNPRIYSRRVKRPETYEKFLFELQELKNNYCAMGRKYGVSDNAIRKWEKCYEKYGI